MPPPINGREYVLSIVSGVEMADTWQAQHDMHLLQFALDPDLPAGVARAGSGALDLACGQAAEGGAGDFDQLLVIHLAGRGEDETARCVMAMHIAPGWSRPGESLTISALPSTGRPMGWSGKAADWK